MGSYISVRQENMKNRIHKKKLNDLKAIMGCLALDRGGLHAGTYLLLALSFFGGGFLSSPASS
jgi:hypothetical protein